MYAPMTMVLLDSMLITGPLTFNKLFEGGQIFHSHSQSLVWQYLFYEVFGGNYLIFHSNIEKKA